MFTGMNMWKKDSQADNMRSWGRVEEGKHATWDWDEKGLFLEGDVFLKVVLKKLHQHQNWLGEMTGMNININETVNISAFKLGEVYGKRDIAC